MKKYELTDITKTLRDGTVLHRIRALEEIPSYWGVVPPGELGGWVEHEKNLSQYDTSWVDRNAWVCGDSVVTQNARVRGEARIWGRAVIAGQAMVCDKARIYGDAYVGDRAMVCGEARVYENAIVSDRAVVGDTAVVRGTAIVENRSLIYSNAKITRPDDILVVGPIGSRNDYTTFFRDKKRGIKVECGCFQGTLDEFLKAVEKTHKNNEHAIAYRAAAQLAREKILNEK